jgi:hypothetical protein
VTLGQLAQPRNRKQQGSDSALSLSIRGPVSSDESNSTWRDTDESKLEALMTEITVEVILTAERQYRDGELRQYEWRIKRKAEIEEQERQHKIAAEKAAKERQQRMTRSALTSSEEFDRWSAWALAQADRIDPAVGGAFTNSMCDEEGMGPT